MELTAPTSVFAGPAEQSRSAPACRTRSSTATMRTGTRRWAARAWPRNTCSVSMPSRRQATPPPTSSLTVRGCQKTSCASCKTVVGMGSVTVAHRPQVWLRVRHVEAAEHRKQPVNAQKVVEQSRAEPHRAVQSHAVPCRAAQSRAEPCSYYFTEGNRPPFAQKGRRQILHGGGLVLPSKSPQLAHAIQHCVWVICHLSSRAVLRISTSIQSLGMFHSLKTL